MAMLEPDAATVTPTTPTSLLTYGQGRDPVRGWRDTTGAVNLLMSGLLAALASAAIADVPAFFHLYVPTVLVGLMQGLWLGLIFRRWVRDAGVQNRRFAYQVTMIAAVFAVVFLHLGLYLARIVGLEQGMLGHVVNGRKLGLFDVLALNARYELKT